MIVGLKADGGGAHTAVGMAEASAFAARYGALCERCSAKDGNNVFLVFERMADKVVRNGFSPEGAPRGGGGGVRVGSQGRKKKGCC